jgi:hypothetical protein
MLGMSLETFTQFHVLLSLVGIVTGFLVIFGIISGRSSSALNAIFLLTTVATSVTGFGFPNEHVTPAQIVGVISLLILAITIPALYFFKLSGAWRWIYVIGATLALYLNFFVLIVQSFLKIPALKALAPKQNEPTRWGRQRDSSRNRRKPAKYISPAILPACKIFVQD